MGWLAVVRHGEAGPGSPDAARRLTPRGEREAAEAGRWLAARPELTGATIWASPYDRAQQTARTVAEAMHGEFETVGGVTPDDDVGALIERLTLFDTARPLIVVSHMPLVGLLTGRLTEGRSNAGVMFPTAGIALLEADVWAAGCASLKAFFSPS
ncbi:phosphohistidine phosphatase SixA [Salinicola salarius]|uniref:phosphohistidine phosphatase SixA n=1 Tax=Salinicola salarius TaxID=430457 RepID=UPI0023E3AB1E|nr:phosphohistidine phosphatase SixA [Salinicola salarius]MDF3919375.1 phosphohistidine phosphatase SixA [Salinicola salarius]